MDREWDEETFDLEAIIERQEEPEAALAAEEDDTPEAGAEAAAEADNTGSAAEAPAEAKEDAEDAPEPETAGEDAVSGEKDTRETGKYPESDWEAITEAVLFTMGKPVELGQLAAAIDRDADTARKVVEELSRRYDEENRGMQIIRLEDSYQLCTRGRFYENLIRVATAPRRHVLTDVALETLSIIAYKQPVTRMEIEKIRGVNSDHAVSRLVEYGLVDEIGRLDAPGRPALFATTEEFLRRFGIGSTENLPALDPVRVEEIRSEVEEELQVDLKELEAKDGQEAGL